MLACEIVGIEMFSQRLMRLRQAATTDDSAANATNAIIIYVNITQISGLKQQLRQPPHMWQPSLRSQHSAVFMIITAIVIIINAISE